MLLLLTIVMVFVLFGECRVNVWRHEPGMAADSAMAFADAAFVRGDVDGAVEQLPAEFLEVISVAQIEGMIQGMHVDGRPDSVEVIGFQKTPGYEGMFIFLDGQSGDLSFHYRLQMEGTASSGYRVTGFWRGLPGSYPNAAQLEPITSR